MKLYNILYKYEKLNNYPVDEKFIQSLKKKKYIYRQSKETKNIVKIPVSNLNIIKCTVL